MRRAPASFALLALLYFASGAAGLVDEVAFFKYLSLVFGATAYASSAVLVAFMGGLALGAALCGRLQHRLVRPLFVYGVMEVLVGASCLLVPALFGGLAKLYVGFAQTASLPALEAMRALLATAIVLVPTTAMGATLPLIARVAGSDAHGSRRLAGLYALNTAGGASGSIACAYALVPLLGLAATLRASAGASVVVGVVAIAVGWDRREEAATAHVAARPADAAPRPELVSMRTLALVAFTSGLLVFACEVVFVHLLALVAGTSVYVFGLVLAVFLVSLSVGAAIARPLLRWRALARSPALALSLVMAATALALVATVPIWDRLPPVFEWLGPYARTWASREAVRALVAFAALFAPVVCMGIAFPMVLQLAARRPDVGAVVGRLTAVNTVGSLAGSLVGGFVMLPLLGSQRSLAVVALLYALVALAVRPRRAREITPKEAWTPLALAAGAVLLVAAEPRWDMTQLASGTNVYFARHLEPNAVVVSTHEDVHGGVTTVTRADHVFDQPLYTLYTNGKFEGDNGMQMAAQHGFAHIPALFAKRQDRALVIGLGTGTTLAAVAAYPFKTVDVAELSPGIVSAARTYFSTINRRVLEDPRVHLRLEDGRNLLLVARPEEGYDLVAIEVSSIWFAGAANLYNEEFYATAAARLREGGVLQQWLQLHHTSRRVLATQLATAHRAFPHMALFIRGMQGILVMSGSPLVADLGRVEALDARPELRSLLGETRLADFLDALVLDEEAIARFVGEVAREEGTTPEALRSTDDNLWLEYATPRNNLPGRMSIEETTEMLARYRPADVVARHLK